MPELPEVEVVRLGLASRAGGDGASSRCPVGEKSLRRQSPRPGNLNAGLGGPENYGP